jgi:hypothetical protein
MHVLKVEAILKDTKGACYYRSRRTKPVPLFFTTNTTWHPAYRLVLRLNEYNLAPWY